MNKEIIKVMFLNPIEFKTWTHKATASAVQAGNAKTGSAALRNVYRTLIKDTSIDSKVRDTLEIWYMLDYKSKLDYIAYNNASNNAEAADFYYMKSEFVRLLMEKGTPKQ